MIVRHVRPPTVKFCKFHVQVRLLGLRIIFSVQEKAFFRAIFELIRRAAGQPSETCTEKEKNRTGWGEVLIVTVLVLVAEPTKDLDSVTVTTSNHHHY